MLGNVGKSRTPSRHLLAFSDGRKTGGKKGPKMAGGEKEITVRALNCTVNRGAVKPHCGFHLNGKCRQMRGAKHGRDNSNARGYSGRLVMHSLAI